MALAIRLDVDELDAKVSAAVLDILRDIGIELVNFVKLEAPVGATGDLKRSWQILEEQPGVVIVGSNLDHALYVQTGTDPHWSPIEPLLVWARRVLSAESAAYGVQQKIAEEGTEPNEYVDRAVERTIKKIT